MEVITGGGKRWCSACYIYVTQVAIKERNWHTHTKIKCSLTLDDTGILWCLCVAENICFHDTEMAGIYVPYVSSQSPQFTKGFTGARQLQSKSFCQTLTLVQTFLCYLAANDVLTIA